MESFTRNGGGLEPPRLAGGSETAAVGWWLEAHINEWHRSHTLVKNERWLLRWKPPCVNRPLHSKINFINIFANT